MQLLSAAGLAALLLCGDAAPALAAASKVPVAVGAQGGDLLEELLASKKGE